MQDVAQQIRAYSEEYDRVEGDAYDIVQQISELEKQKLYKISRLKQILEQYHSLLEVQRVNEALIS
jgi:hypothetical protein